MKKYRVIGLMSGTSLDGLDIAYCEFTTPSSILPLAKGETQKGWQYRIIFAETISYNKKWKEKLSSAFTKPKKEISKLDVEFGKFIGEKVNTFIKKNKIKPDFISSHGHTIFHQPEKKFTLQIGNGKLISSLCKLPAVCGFRIGDAQLGGQGAPLVPE